MLKKLLLVLIKYMPIVQAVGMLLNNTLYKYDIYWISYILDYLIGNSIIFIILMFIISYVFKFCFWYRMMLVNNAISMTISIIDCCYQLPITDLELLLVHYYVFFTSITIITIYHIKHIKRNEHKVKND